MNEWDVIFWLGTVSAGLAASLHAVLHKRDVRSAAGWVSLAWLVPVAGPLVYLLLGINRIRRRAVQLSAHSTQWGADLSTTLEQEALEPLPLPLEHPDLFNAIGRVTQRRLLPGNRIVPLANGDETYPAMLDAIASAKRSISLCTYIFETRGVGAQFLGALGAAVARGVQVRVLIDDVGARYATPRPQRELRRRGVPNASFMPVRAIWRAPYFNLRNHRKVLVVDGEVGFTGGINIRAGHVLADRPRDPTRDLHFRVEGPIVAHLAEVFAKDWAFSTGELLDGPDWFPPHPPRGPSLARGITDGPDEDIDRFTWTLHAALACARRSVVIMTPYFLPDAALVTALNTTALRGVGVDVLLPEECNLKLIKWAMARQLEEVLGGHVRVFLTPPPFDHTKLMLVDDEWSLFGSANWDARSLRLNFELDVEAYDASLNRRLRDHAKALQQLARPLSRRELLARPYLARVRDGFARLLMPYL